MSSNGIVLDAEQRNAVDMCVDTTKRLVSVTGEAGTGKTTIIKKSHSQSQHPQAKPLVVYVKLLVTTHRQYTSCSNLIAPM
jgi:type II secretory pathway predicted ATPase ExeA